MIDDQGDREAFIARVTDTTNPKAALGAAKVPLHLWPAIASAMGAMGLLEGKEKYGRSNYRATPVVMSIYTDAMKRHLDAFFEGEDIDLMSGLSHMCHILADAAIIVDAMAAGSMIDDRMYPGGYRAAMDALTPHVDRIKALHEKKDPKHYTIKDAPPVPAPGPQSGDAPSLRTEPHQEK